MNYCESFCRTIQRLCNAGGGDGIILPDGYQRVDYLQSSGSQYLRVGELRNYTYFEAEFKFVNFVNNAFGSQYGLNGVFGANAANTTELGRVDTKVWYTSSSQISVTVRTTSMGSANITTNTKYKLYVSKESVTLNGTTLNTSTAGNMGVSTIPFCVFAVSSGDSNPANNACAMKLYRFSSNYGNLIPCYRKSDNKPGMYDIVNNTFYTNAGTGEFTVGSNV